MIFNTKLSSTEIVQYVIDWFDDNNNSISLTLLWQCKLRCWHQKKKKLRKFYGKSNDEVETEEKNL